MKKALMVLGLVAVVLLAVGCSKTYSYTYEGQYCYEWTTDVEFTGYDEAECDTAGSVGTCAYTTGGYDYTYVYYEETYTAAEGEAACDALGGDWTAE